MLLSPDEYIKLMDEVNDARLLTLATERMAKYDPEDTVSEDEVLKELGITADELANAAQRLRKHGL